jgi:hypothetical protein
MPVSRTAPHRRKSVFGPGRRVPVDREFRAVYKAKLRYNRRPNRLTFACVAVGDYLVRACGTDGRLDPSNDTIAAACGIAPSTAAAARKRLRLCGFLDWDRRVLRVPDRGNLLGYCVVQISNAYELRTLNHDLEICCDADLRKATRKTAFPLRENSIAAEDAAAFASRDRQLRLLALDL